MKNWLKYALLATLAISSMRAVAENSVVMDTVYFYDSWDAMMTQTPDAMLVAPFIDTLSPFEVYITVGDDRFDEVIQNEHLAATLGDSIWLINTEMLKKDFKGDARKLHGVVPVFFNEKVVFATYASPSDEISLKNILFGVNDENLNYDDYVNYYYLDFLNRKVLKVTPTVLSELLEDYHDLQMRYEGMKDYKKRPIIQDYFFKFVDRASSDIMRPDVLDLVQ